jgi:glutathione S-transferase
MLRLVCSSTCPLALRVAIVLRQKGAPFVVEYLDAEPRPAWFARLSPRGHLPLLQLNAPPDAERVGGEVLFDVSAICEYVEETHPDPRLLPTDSVARARERALVALLPEDLLEPLHRFALAATTEAQDAARAQLERSFARLAAQLRGKRQFLSGGGASFGMADAAAAPGVHRLEALRRRYGVDLLSGSSALQSWASRILALPAVGESVPPAWDQQHHAALVAAGSLLTANARPPS